MSSIINIKNNSIKKDSTSYLNDSKFKSSIFKKEESKKLIIKFKIILLGDVSVGKTALMNRYMYGQYNNEYQCTINAESRIKEIPINEEITAQMTIWDTCGEEKYKALTRQYYRETNGILLIFDLCNRNSFLNLKKWLNEISEIAPKEVSIVLVGNKVDMKREVSLDEINQFVSDNLLTYFEISAKNGINVDFAFEKLAKEIVNNLNNENYNTIVDSISNNESMHSSGSIQLHDKSYDRKANIDNNNQNLNKFLGCC